MPRARKSPAEKVAELERKKAQLDARIQKQRARARQDDRKRDTRRKIVAGAIVLEHAEKDPGFAAVLNDLLRRFVTRDQDKDLFDLSS